MLSGEHFVDIANIVVAVCADVMAGAVVAVIKDRHDLIRPRAVNLAQNIASINNDLWHICWNGNGRRARGRGAEGDGPLGYLKDSHESQGHPRLTNDFRTKLKFNGCQWRQML